MSRSTQIARSAASMSRSRRLGPRAPSDVGSGACRGPIGVRNDEARLSDLDPVPRPEDDLRDAVAIDARAVRRSKIGEDEHAVAWREPRVSAGDAIVVEHQLALR